MATCCFYSQAGASRGTRGVGWQGVAGGRPSRALCWGAAGLLLPDLYLPGRPPPGIHPAAPGDSGNLTGWRQRPSPSQDSPPVQTLQVQCSTVSSSPCKETVTRLSQRDAESPALCSQRGRSVGQKGLRNPSVCCQDHQGCAPALEGGHFKVALTAPPLGAQRWDRRVFQNKSAQQ